jgi:branched-chain amino acid transport system ATP-binding protein
VLQVEDLRVRYGSLEVVKGISFAVGEGEIVTILGSNGAGKTTTLRTVAGLHRPAGGRVMLGGRSIGGLGAYQVAALGASLVPEGRQLFPDHTVRENLELGAYLRLRRGDRRAVTEDIEGLFELFPQIQGRLQQRAGSLSGGEQQMVAIARALVARPTLLLMDEPSLGLAPLLIRSIFDALVKLRAQGLTILLVEQMAWLGLGVCDRAYILESGRLVLTGTRDEVMRDPRIVQAYLGKADGAAPAGGAPGGSSDRWRG